jgi:hypothetical protein
LKKKSLFPSRQQLPKKLFFLKIILFYFFRARPDAWSRPCGRTLFYPR